MLKADVIRIFTPADDSVQPGINYVVDPYASLPEIAVTQKETQDTIQLITEVPKFLLVSNHVYENLELEKKSWQPLISNLFF